MYSICIPYAYVSRNSRGSSIVFARQISMVCDATRSETPSQILTPSFPQIDAFENLIPFAIQTNSTQISPILSSVRRSITKAKTTPVSTRKRLQFKAELVHRCLAFTRVCSRKIRVNDFLILAACFSNYYYILPTQQHITDVTKRLRTAGEQRTDESIANTT
jgi:hypothetical protein